MKQDTLASMIGVSQGALSKIEQSETVDDEKIKQIANALGISTEALKNFNEDAAINNIQNNYDSSVVNSQITYAFNPIEKMTELYEENKRLYERLLESERKKVELMEMILNKK